MIFFSYRSHFSAIFYPTVLKKKIFCFSLGSYSLFHGEREHWTVNYTDTQSILITLSYLYLLCVLFFSFDWFNH